MAEGSPIKNVLALLSGVAPSGDTGKQWATIPLTKGKFSIVDLDVFEELCKYNWFFVGGYAARNITVGPKKQKQVPMHWLVLGDPPPGFMVDHRNGNKLDNRKQNLRFCTNSQNQQNKKPTGTYKGVCFHKRKQKWIASIFAEGRRIHLGYYAASESAARAYDEAARKHFGEFARTNFESKVVA